MKNWKIVALLILGVFVVSACIYLAIPEKSKYKEKPVSIDENIYYPVTHILDGDTFGVTVKGKDITIRMLGIDTPETVDPRKPAQCYGKEASDETKRLLSDSHVQLKLNPKREVRDKYGRYLAYVYRDDGLFVNEYLLENGFAREYTYGKPYSLQGTFKVLEKKVQSEKKGLWKKCEYQSANVRITTDNTNTNN